VLDLFQTMKFAALVQKQHRWDATVLAAQRVLDMATRDGADALHRADLGRLVPGATADLILVDFRRPHLVPRHDTASHLVYAASGADVSATVVGGRVLMAEGRVETLDAPRILRDVQDCADDIVRKAGLPEGTH
ncbi:MAG: 5-methylthioadenosine/S-adenosylhomocysteine deaminase, partial [Thermoplasmata archaeon]|nr:5-methylthioadenosine/S-adenosylhomocysteine deaminase [Thermoplasmata archaeon]